MINRETHNNVQIISLSGQINAMTIANIAQTPEVTNQHIIIDLREVSDLDSAGMAWIVRFLKTIRQFGRKAIMVWSKYDHANRIIRLTQFDKIFQMAPDVHTALQSV